MKIFPSHKYTIELNETSEVTLANLKDQTLESSSLYSQTTDKKFIGTITRNSFKVIGSEIGIGAFTVFIGTLDGMSGTVTTRINIGFKILISALYIFLVISVVWTVIDFGILKSTGLLVPLAMGVILIRFGITGLFYKISSKTTMQKLKTDLGIKSINQLG